MQILVKYEIFTFTFSYSICMIEKEHGHSSWPVNKEASLQACMLCFVQIVRSLVNR